MLLAGRRRRPPAVSRKFQQVSSKFQQSPAKSRMLDVRDHAGPLFADTHTVRRDRTSHDSTKKEKGRRFGVGAPTLPLLPAVREVEGVWSRQLLRLAGVGRPLPLKVTTMTQNEITLRWREFPHRSTTLASAVLSRVTRSGSDNIGSPSITIIIIIIMGNGHYAAY
jgi:hypothetical protein